MDDSYLAGFFDGEGCLHASNARGWVNLRASMSQKNPEVLEKIQDYLGYGKIHRHRNTGVHHLNICGRRNVREFIRRVYPYSVVKRRQLKVAYALVSGPPLPKEERLKVKEELHKAKRTIP